MKRFLNGKQRHAWSSSVRLDQFNPQVPAEDLRGADERLKLDALDFGIEKTVELAAAGVHALRHF